MRVIAILTFFALCLTTTHAQVPSYVPTNGLVGWWPFNGNANDESGLSSNGVVTGANLTSNRLGNANAAYEFSTGTTSQINIPIASPISNEFTMHMWVKPTRAINYIGESNACPGTVTVPLANSNQNWAYEPSSADIGVGLSIGTNGVLVAEHSQNLLVSRMSYQASISDFVAVTIVYRTDSIFLYVNGSRVRERNLICVNPPHRLQFQHRLGSVLYSPNFSGIIDDFGVWSVALTEAQVQDLYNAQTQCTSPLTASFLGLASGYTVGDAPSALVGTPSGGVYFGDGVTGNSFNPAVAGVGTHGISYVYVDTAGCVSSYAQCTEVTLSVGVGGSNMSPGGVLVYPNPNRGQFTLEVDLDGLVSLQVYDAGGRLAHSEVFQASGTKTIRNLDLSGKAKGTYTLQVRNDGGVVTQMVVVE